MKLLKTVAVFVFLSACSDSHAAKTSFEFEKMDFKYRNISAEQSTIVGLDSGSLKSVGKIKGWGVIETSYSSNPKWADDVDVKYYVLLKGEKGGKPVMLTGSNIYMNVREGRQHISNMYIPPQVISRYGEVIIIRAEIWYNGIIQDAVYWPKAKGVKSAWWTQVKPLQGSLFNRYYTPFEHEAQMKEEMIKVE